MYGDIILGLIHKFQGHFPTIRERNKNCMSVSQSQVTHDVD